MKIQSMLLLFALVGVLLASSLNEDNSEEALLQEDDLKGGKADFLAKLASLKTSPSEDEAPSLLQEDDLKGGKADFLAKLASLKTSPSEDEAPFWGELWNIAKDLIG
ncbi:uncharacterized protein ACWYII_003480 isoform 1-T3 [Salvelinus alpinus]